MINGGTVFCSISIRCSKRSNIVVKSLNEVFLLFLDVGIDTLPFSTIGDIILVRIIEVFLFVFADEPFSAIGAEMRKVFCHCFIPL